MYIWFVHTHFTQFCSRTLICRGSSGPSWLLRRVPKYFAMDAPPSAPAMPAATPPKRQSISIAGERQNKRMVHSNLVFLPKTNKRMASSRDRSPHHGMRIILCASGSNVCDGSHRWIINVTQCLQRCISIVLSRYYVKRTLLFCFIYLKLLHDACGTPSEKEFYNHCGNEAAHQIVRSSPKHWQHQRWTSVPKLILWSQNIFLSHKPHKTVYVPRFIEF